MTDTAVKVSRSRAKKLDATAARARFAAESAADDRRTGNDELMRRALCESMSRHGYTDMEIATYARVHRPQVELWRSNRKPDLPNLSHVLCMPPEVRDDLLRAVALAAGRELIDVEEATGCMLSAVADLDREASEARIATLKALADGYEDEQELVDQSREHHQAASLHLKQVARCNTELHRRRVRR